MNEPEDMSTETSQTEMYREKKKTSKKKNNRTEHSGTLGQFQKVHIHNWNTRQRENRAEEKYEVSIDKNFAKLMTYTKLLRKLKRASE